MATIDYKQKIKDYMNSSEVDTLYKSMLNNLFPELAESEDERIRKDIIVLVKDWWDRVNKDNISTKEQMIAWLEKQGEHANFRNKIQIGDKVTRNEDGMLVNLSQLKRIAKKDEKQGEQKPTEEYNITGISSNKSQGKLGEIIKNLKSSWSEEDEQMQNRIISDIESLKEQVYCKSWCDEEINWLKSIKDRVQPKQEWSEEDEGFLNLLLAVFTNEHPNGIFSTDNITVFNGNCVPSKRIIAWLKSLRPKSTWKPSGEQMEALKHAFNNGSIDFDDMKILATLYEQLKRRKE